MQVNDTVRAVHTAPGLPRRAFFGTVLSVQPSIPGETGTNGEPSITLGFVDPKMLNLVGTPEFHKAYRRQTTVRHASHDEVQQGATEFCWTDVLPSDGGPIALAGLNMQDLSAPAADAAEAPSTIGTMVYEYDGIEAWHKDKDLYLVDWRDEIFTFTDLFSAQMFVDAKSRQQNAEIAGRNTPAALKADVAGKLVEIKEYPEPAAHPFRVVIGGEEVAMFDTRGEAVSYLAEMENNAESVTTIPAPSAADLDAVADEQKAADETSGAQVIADELPPDSPDPLAAL